MMTARDCYNWWEYHTLRLSLSCYCYFHQEDVLAGSCLFVCLLATSRKNYWSGLCKHSTRDISLDKEVTVKFCKSSGCRNFLKELLPLWDRGNSAYFTDNSRKLLINSYDIFEGLDVSLATNRLILVLIWNTISFIKSNYEPFCLFNNSTTSRWNCHY